MYSEPQDGTQNHGCRAGHYFQVPTLSIYLPPAMNPVLPPSNWLSGPLPPNSIPTLRPSGPKKPPLKLHRTLAVMHAKSYAKRVPTRTQPSRRAKDKAKEIRDHECDIALDSTPEVSKTPSRTTDSQTPAQQPETQRRNEAERGSPTASRTGASGRKGGRLMISKDIQRLQNKMCLINSHRPCKHS